MLYKGLCCCRGSSPRVVLLTSPRALLRQVMACPGGCIGGGGQPKTHDPDAVLKRMGAIYNVRQRAIDVRV